MVFFRGIQGLEEVPFFLEGFHGFWRDSVFWRHLGIWRNPRLLEEFLGVLGEYIFVEGSQVFWSITEV